MSDDIAIKVENLTKIYKLYNTPVDRLKEALSPIRRKYHHDFHALQNVSFEVKKGETVGIVGRNGSGKSTLLKIITGVLTPTSGSVTVNGRISALLELGAGFNPELTGIENVYFNGTLMGYSREEMDSKLDEILGFADIGEFVRQPIKTYSSGMFVRLAFAVAANVAPDVFIVDEALSVGDVFFQQKCYSRLKELKDAGVTILFVTHGMQDVVQYCQKGVLLNNNRLEYKGASAETVKRYLLVQQQDRLAEYAAKVSKKTPQQFDQQGDNHDFFWPHPSQFLDLSGVDVVTSGMAKCTAVAICNVTGSNSKLFAQGDTGTIFCEFEINRAIEVPIAGFIIKNAQNIMVHGKNSLQYDDLVLPTYLQEKQRVRIRFDVKLDIAPGDYTVDVGLATLHAKDYDERSFLSPIQVQAKTLRLCNLSGAASFTVINQPTVDDGYDTLHCGICNLIGYSKISILKPENMLLNPERAQTHMPTIFHVTHWKAGSQWLKKILQDAAPNLFIAPKIGVAHFLNDPIAEGMIYPTVYVTKEQFESVSLPFSWIRFVVIRDLRDTLISGYFSLKVSHSIISLGVVSLRDKLLSLNLEEGLLYLMDNWLDMSAAIQQSWVDSGEEIVKYEELLAHDIDILVRILIDKCHFPISHEKLKEVIINNRFETLTGGRERGVEDITAHERKGIGGDWRNYFTEKIKIHFKQKYGALLIATGYERDERW